MEENGKYSFDQMLFMMLKNAIKQASYEIMVESNDMEDRELTDEEWEEALNELVPQVEETPTLTIDRMTEMVDDYRELGNFADSLNKIGFFKSPEDVVSLLREPNKFRKQYMVWVELDRPKPSSKEFERFGQAVWNREKIQ